MSDVTILTKQNPKSYLNRYLSYFLSAEQIFLPIVTATLAIWLSYYYTKKYNLSIYIFICLVIIIISYRFIIEPLQRTKFYLIELKLQHDFVKMVYMHKNTTVNKLIPTKSFLFSTNSLDLNEAAYIIFFELKHKIFTLYPLGDLDRDFLKSLARNLNRNGIKRPMGENL